MTLEARFQFGEASDVTVPETIFGVNLEQYQHAVTSLGNDRLDNPKFAGPVDVQTGIARDWRSPSANFSGIHYQLLPGEGIMGSDAQMMENTSGEPNVGIVQPARWIREGETLEVIFWARCIHNPCKVEVGLRPPSPWAPPTASAEVLVDAASWREYRCSIDIPLSTDSAVFFCYVKERGIVCLDQIHLRPEGEGTVNQALLDKLGEYRIPAIRFPGGCVTTCYHWQYGTGPAHLRPVLPDPVFKLDTRYDFGTDEYLTFCHANGITPHLSVNIGTDTPGETEAWAAYCWAWFKKRDVEPPLFYWQLGNEHYGAWERSHMTPQMYIEEIKRLAPSVRSAYPNARIVILGQKSTWDFSAEATVDWRTPVLAECKDLIDVIASQHYCIIPSEETPQGRHDTVFKYAEGIKIELTDEHSAAEAAGVGSAMSEWNLWTNASHFNPEGFIEPLDMQHCLFAATLFHHFARLAPCFELANYYNLLAGMGLFTFERGVIKTSALVDIFRLYREAFPARRVNAEFTSPKLVEKIDAIDLIAVDNDAGRVLFAINKSLTESVSVALPEEMAGASRQTYYANAPGDLELKQEEGALDGPEMTLRPLSINKLTIAR